MYGSEPMFKDETVEIKNENPITTLPPNLNLFDEVPSAAPSFSN